MKLLIGGSPCTHWSIAQTKNRETEASGIGWELFLNYRIARDKYKPDYFLYENNKSMSPAIRTQITAELGVEPVLINSALVSAQNRQRLYWVGKREPDGTYSQVPVEQPEDRGVLLRDILETGIAWQEKAYNLTTRCCGAIPSDTLKRHRHTMVAEPVRMRDILKTSTSKKGYALDPTHAEVLNMNPSGHGMKSVTLCGNGGGLGAKTGLYAVPVAGRVVGRRINEQGHRDDYNEAIPHFQYFEVNEEPQKTNCLTTVQKDNMIAVPVIPDGKGQFVIKAAGGKEIPVYEVRGGRITIKEKTYPIKLRDGFYIIRKLTVTECKRLQTVPEEYVFPVSNSQAYKMLGNGWTVDVIAHIMSHFTGLTEGPVEVLSMYDGMSCGHIALDKLGATVATYYATEIDKYVIQTTQHNYPDTIQLGDAFQVRNDDWRVKE